MTEMSKNAKSALINATGRRGARVTTALTTLKKLRENGLVSAAGGLTTKGLIVRTGLVEGALDKAF